MNLKPRLLLLTTALLLTASVGIWLLTERLALQVLEQWALRNFDTQVRLEKTRSLAPIIRETALARQFADSQTLRQWAREPDNLELRANALAEMESFRRNFADQSFFVALRESGAYYHNNASNEFAGQELRYYLKPGNPDDYWFYRIIEQNRDLHLNVNPDIPLQVTKLWIDVLLRDGDQILGVVGTGLDLTRFIEEVMHTTDPGISQLFFDHEGAIQVSRDQTQIDFASITKTKQDKKTIRQWFSATEQQALQHWLEYLPQHPDEVGSLRLRINGTEHLAGVMYLPEIDWFVMTLLDLNTLLPLSTFRELLILALFLLALALLIFHLALSRYVLNPLNLLEQAIVRLRGQHPSLPDLPQHTSGEVGRLLQHFQAMAEETLQARNELETKVQERTEALEKLSQTDALTGLLNRRGMELRLEQEYDRLQREQQPFGLLWLDLDDFKQINDHYGHAAGDQALRLTARVVREHIRPYDSAARWGGDEFLILLQNCDQATLDRLGERLCNSIRHVQSESVGLPQLQLSAGSAMASAELSLEQILAMADQALYRAKATGRNRYCHNLPPDQSEP